MRGLITIALLSAATLAAQRVPTVVNSSIPRPVPAGGYRFGNILYPGGLPPQQQTHAGRLGAVIGGGPFPGGGVGGPRNPNFPNSRNRTIVVPYAVPVYYGDAYGYAGGYPYQQETPNVTVVMPQQPAPSVIINHNYSPDTAKPAMRDYSDSDLPESGGIKVYEGSARKQADAPAQPPPPRRVASDKPTIYLIALKDSTIRQAIGYWIEDGALHYVTPQSTISQVSLDTVDRQLSEQLNAERSLEFDLNAARR
jgi:hypothetical protein